MVKEGENLRKHIELKAEIEPLAKIAPKDEYVFNLYVEITKDGKTKYRRITIKQEEPVNYHQGISELKEKVEKARENHDRVDPIEFQRYYSEIESGSSFETRGYE